MPAFIEARHDAVEGGEVVAVVFGLEWFHHYGIGVDVKVQHDVVVATAGANWEAACGMCVKLYYGLQLD